ncbi:MAG: hypothetical protein LC104_18575 [Bacteroidales bacterium]|nr:hypothetical protein [Bacteroidales bacterium]
MSIRQLVLAVALLVPSMGSAQVVYPQKSDQSDVWIHYRIRADQAERIRQYRAMTAYFQSLKFAPAEREDADLDIFDPTAEYTHGSIPTANAAKLLGDPRVITIVTAPTGWAQPAADQKIPVQMRLAGPLAPREQRMLHEQVARHLGLLGFTEGISYDHLGYTLMRGTLPAGNLFKLLRDLRGQPSGWFLTEVPPRYLPAPLRNIVPIKLVEVLPEPMEAVPAFQPPAKPTGKLTEDLQAVVSDPARQTEPLRVEAVLETVPVGAARDVRFVLQNQVSGATLEGIIGTVATIRLQKVADVSLLAVLPNIRTLRLPRAGHDTLTSQTANALDPVQLNNLMASSKVSELHRLGYRGEGLHIVVIGTGFPGVDDQIGRELPHTTQVIDLTAELQPSLKPLPAAAATAPGKLVAQTAHLVAPAARLTLVRVDPNAFHQLLTVARAVVGRQEYSVAMLTRSVELVRRGEELQFLRRKVVEEYRDAFSNLSDDPQPTARRETAAKAMQQLQDDERDVRDRFARLTALKNAIDGLAGAQVVINTLVWESGYPLDGLSAVSEYLTARFAGQPPHVSIGQPKRPDIPVWVQAGSNAVGRVWAGPFRDHDGNGIMEFTDAKAALPQKRWTPELNFLRYVPQDGMPGLVIPAETQIRFTVQWREPHPTDQLLPAEPVFPLTLRLLRQLDPEGKTRASDEMVEVARSSVPPTRLMRTSGSGVYEVSLDVTIPADGVYALRVDGKPAANPAIPALETGWELYPRIVIDPVNAAAESGLVLFDSFAPRAAGVGIPGDSPAALTVGVGKPAAYQEPLSLSTGGPGLALSTKPDLLSAGTILIDATGGTGPGMATGFAGGTAALLGSAGVRGSELVRAVNLRPGGPLVLPSYWLSHLRPRTAKVGSER